MKYRLFVSDFDGTLFKKDGTVSEYVKRTINKYREMGGIFAVCSGRALTSVLHETRAMGLDGLAVAFQGAVVADIQTGRLLKNDFYKREEIEEVLRYLEETDDHVHIYTLDDYYSNRDDEALKLYEKIVKASAKVMAGKPLFSKLLEEKRDIYKILIVIDPAQQQARFKELSALFGQKYFITCSADCLIEILPYHSRKSAAVQFLQAYYKIGKEQTAAIGDQMNDLPLLSAAGGKFAVANAVNALKEIAQVVPSCEEDGVAVVLEKIMAGEEL